MVDSSDLTEGEELVAAGYDAVYTGEGSALLQRIWAENASGLDYPRDYANISFVTVPDLQEISDATQLEPGSTLVDLACGAGGPGLWVAQNRSARLVGVDIAAAGVAAATARAGRIGYRDVAEFRVGSFAATGLGSGSAQAAMSIDALQYAPDKASAFDEAARILQPHSHLVFTAFEVAPDKVAGLPVLGDDPVEDYRPLLESAGFTVLRYAETLDWWPRMKAAYGAVLDASEPLVAEMGAEAVAALSSELALTLEIEPYRRRVLCVAERSQVR